MEAGLGPGCEDLRWRARTKSTLRSLWSPLKAYSAASVSLPVLELDIWA